ncbi:MAG: exosortase [Deltaproteobacteria bacterium]|nr:MAG: exosortase [Deltaproteobacteria bacterium]
MVRQWSDDPNFSHGFLVPLFSAFLIWRRRYEIHLFPAASSCGKGLILLGIGLVFLVIGKAGGEHFTIRFSLVLVLAAICALVTGWEGLRKCFFAFAFLVFMIPIPYIIYDWIAFPLKLLASEIGEISLRAAGIPVFRDGNIINLASLQLEVADACSGIRFLYSMTALATVTAYFLGLGIIRGGILFLSAIPASVGANSSRIFMTGAISNRYGAEYAKGFFHEISGTLVFLSCMIIVVSFGVVLSSIGNRHRKLAEDTRIGLMDKK